MTDDLKQRTEELIGHLRDQGHTEEAEHLADRLGAHAIERGLLFVLREACETVLTAIEAIDPVSQMMIENLRLDVEKRLIPAEDQAHHTGPLPT